MDLTLLPDDMINIIFDFLPIRYKIFLTKEFYLKYHNKIYKYISLYESYLKCIIRNDNSFAFSEIIKDHLEKWNNHKKYSYKTYKFGNYNFFVEYLIWEYNAKKCSDIWSKKNKERGYGKHKKNIIRYIKWN